MDEVTDRLRQAAQSLGSGSVGGLQLDLLRDREALAQAGLRAITDEMGRLTGELAVRSLGFCRSAAWGSEALNIFK